MIRTQKKVKDLVEVRPYKSLPDFLSNSFDTLAGYHFTDFTADLMAKFLDKIVSVQNGGGAAFALAGYRGVGKSHFLAAFGAIVSHVELRQKISEQIVVSAAQRLKRTNYPTAYVRRGTHETLFEEIKDAIAKTFNIVPSNLDSALPEVLKFAAENASESTFVLIIDTAFDRNARVARDDGALLGEIAGLAKKLNFFVAVALDDDIAGADGLNASIAKNFNIEYLDQEHLYRIVDRHIFQKQLQVQPLIHEIYSGFREALPHFRWSEQRFSALYPLHPVILEIAPFVRLYVQDFALLGFASETGAKILGRPANSLIALDEVFDSVENSLRKISDLKEAFAVYDKLNSLVIAQIPVFQRLQAKLVLKALFLFSLKGEGASAGEIGAAMLIYDETDPPKAVRMVKEILEKFAAAFPDDVQRTAESNREVRYGLEISGSDKLNAKLIAAAKMISPAVIPKILRAVARTKFSDWAFPDENSSLEANQMDSQIVWRGSLRRGRLFWNLENETAFSRQNETNAKLYDWEISIVAPDEKIQTGGETEIPQVFWQPAELKKDEAETIAKYYVLQTDTALREEFGEQIRAVGQSYLNAVEKIWNRMFLTEAQIFIGGFDYNFSTDAQSANNLAEILSKVLDPLFEAQFPGHPNLAEPLAAEQVAVLVNDFFSGARPNLPEVQKLAATFAAPLGLVAARKDAYVIETEENLGKLAFAQEILFLVNNTQETISLATINQIFKQNEFGLAREAQQLILTALVAQRLVEFVTANGNRINRRSLDLKFSWNDIEGIGKPETVVYSNERLIEWAAILTKSDFPASFETPDERQVVSVSLKTWLSDWQESRIFERFAALPDEILNTKIWRQAARSEKIFGSVAETVRAVSDETVSIEEGLHRIADAFSDSEKEYFDCRNDLTVLENFIGGAKTRETVWAYLAICETTQDNEIEALREQLFRAVKESYAKPNEAVNNEMEELWQTFSARFGEHFAVKHDSIMKSPHLQEKCDELMRSDALWEFENLSRLEMFRHDYWSQAQKISRQIKELDCKFNVRELLETHPFCACSFSLAKMKELENLPRQLDKIIDEGLRKTRAALKSLSPVLIPSIERFSENNTDAELLQPIANLRKALLNNDESPHLSSVELSILQKINESFIKSETAPDINQLPDDLPNERLLSKNTDSLIEKTEAFILDFQ